MIRVAEVLPKLYAVVSYGLSSNSYVIMSEPPVIVDTGLSEVTNRITELLAGKEAVVVFTHAHFDHTGGFKLLSKRIECYTVASREDGEALVKGDESRILHRFFGIREYRINIDRFVKEGSVIEAGSYRFTVLETPGHTPGSICLYDREHRILISGDTVFTGGGVGRVDFPGGSFSRLLASVRRLASLDVRVLLPGHGSIETRDGGSEIKLALMMVERIGSSFF